MSLSERSSVGTVWQERLHWARYHLLAVGPLAVLTASAYATLGAVSVVAFVVPAVLLGRLMRDAVPPEAEPEARPVLAAAA